MYIWSTIFIHLGMYLDRTTIHRMCVSVQMVSSQNELPIPLMMVSSHSSSFHVLLGYTHVQCTLSLDISMFISSRTNSLSW